MNLQKSLIQELGEAGDNAGNQLLKKILLVWKSIDNNTSFLEKDTPSHGSG
jgi:hypothetical protein